jgi:hypothetical protein
MRLTGASFLLAAMLFTAVSAAAPRATGNRVQNAGAEVGVGATKSEAIVDVPSWETEDSFTAVAYGTSGFPAAGSGKNFFAGGPNQPLSSASQWVDLSDRHEAIEDGRMEATLSALLGGWESQEDAASVTAVFLDSSSKQISGTTIGPVTAAARGGRTELLHRETTVAVPPRTDAARIVITARRASGAYNDGYADDVSLTLEERPAAARETYGFRVRLKAEAVRGAKMLLPSYIQTFAGGDGSISLRPTEVLGHFVVQHDFVRFSDQRTLLDLVNLNGVEGVGFGRPGTAYWFRATVRASTLRRCKHGAPASVSFYDAPRGKPDRVGFRFCGVAVEYANGKPDPGDRVSVSVRP